MPITPQYVISCDRCDDQLGPVHSKKPDAPMQPLLVVEGPEFGVATTEFSILCDPCKKEVKPLLQKLLEKKRKRNKSGGES